MDSDDRAVETPHSVVTIPNPLLSSPPVAIRNKGEGAVAGGVHNGALADNLHMSPCERAVVPIGYCNNVAVVAPVGSDILRAQPLLLSVLAAFDHS